MKNNTKINITIITTICLLFVIAINMGMIESIDEGEVIKINSYIINGDEIFVFTLDNEKDVEVISTAKAQPSKVVVGDYIKATRYNGRIAATELEIIEGRL